MTTPIQEGLVGMLIQSPTHPNLSPTPASVDSSLMAPGETLRERALITQDILSSLDAEALPSETCPTIFDNIVHNSVVSADYRPPKTEWTIQRDLPGSILNRAAYNEGFFNEIFQLQSPGTRATIFRQKIEQRVRLRISRYDELAGLPPASASDFADALMIIVHDLRELSSIVHKDRELRQSEAIGETVETQAAAAILTFLERICERDRVVSHAGHYTRSASTINPDLTLFRQLIGRDSPEGEPFFLASLERFESYALTGDENLAKMISVRDMLEELNAPARYLNRYKALWKIVSDPVQQPVSSGSSGHESGHEADTSTRRKRTQEEPEDLPTRAKRRKKTA